MSKQHGDTPAATTPTPGRGSGWQWPDIGWLFKRLTSFAGGCLTILSICLLALVLAGWWGWSAITSTTPAQTRRPAYIPGKTYDPLGCGAKGEWVVSWDTAQGKRYACTGAWR